MRENHLQWGGRHDRRGFLPSGGARFLPASLGPVVRQVESCAPTGHTAERGLDDHLAVTDAVKSDETEVRGAGVENLVPPGRTCGEEQDGGKEGRGGKPFLLSTRQHQSNRFS